MISWRKIVYYTCMKSSHWRIKKGYIVQEVPEGIVIFDAGESKLYTFNETAALIFQGFKEHKTVEQIAVILVKEYEVSRERAKTEIKSLIQSLESFHIIETYEQNRV